MARTMRATTNPEQPDEQPKRRGRPSKHPLPGGGNVTDATVDEFCSRVLRKKSDLEKNEEETKRLRGIYRAELKAAKDAGVDPDAITWWLQKRRLEPEDLNREIGWQNRIAKLRNLPIGTQLGVDFATGETIAHEIDKKKIAKEKKKTERNGGADPKMAYALGHSLGKEGKSPKRAGHRFDGDAAVEFQKGWQQGQADRAAELGPESAAVQ